MFHISSFGEQISTQGEKSKMARYLVKIQFPSTRSQDELLLRCPTLPFCTSVSLLRLPWLLFDNTAGPKSEDRLIICCENSKYGFDENFYGYFALAQRVPTFANCLNPWWRKTIWTPWWQPPCTLHNIQPKASNIKYIMDFTAVNIWYKRLAVQLFSWSKHPPIDGHRQSDSTGSPWPSFSPTLWQANQHIATCWSSLT